MEGPLLRHSSSSTKVLAATSTALASGMVGLVTSGEIDARDMAMFNNLIANMQNGPPPKPTESEQDAGPIHEA